MARFLISTVLFAWLSLSGAAFAQDFHWTHPGGYKYTGTVEQALAAFADIVPPQARALLLQKVRSGQKSTDEVTSGFRVTRMMFGNGQRVPNVVVSASDFQSPWWRGASKRLDVYEVTIMTNARKVTYTLYRPWECGNWSVAVYTFQGECIKDELLCDEGCQKIKAHQRVSWAPQTRWEWASLIPNFFSSADGVIDVRKRVDYS
jgi:hypothetical protein